MKFNKYFSALLLILLPSLSHSVGLDEDHFAYLSFLTFNKQTEIYKKYCEEDEEYLALFIESEKEFIKNSPKWVEINNNPPRYKDEVEKIFEKDSEELVSKLKEYLDNAPIESTCEIYSHMLRNVPFSKHLGAGWSNQ